MINTIIRYKADNMKLAYYYLYFLSSWRLANNKWNRHAYGYILNRYFSRYSLTKYYCSFVFINNSNTPT